MIWKQFFSIIAVLSLILGSWKGYVALFEKGSDEPTQIFPTTVAALPEADRANLEEGIIIRNQAALDRILEDYLS